jgi:Spy/CpxP family protein refolding chaperone
MNGLRMFAAFAVLGVLAAGAWAARERGRGRRAKEPAVSQYDLMVGELKLTDQQKAQLKEKIKAKEAAAAAWDKANAKRIEAADEAVQAAKGGGDSAARKSASQAKKELQAERDRATADAEAAILAVLTAEQKAAWDGLLLYQTVAARYRKVELTEEQTAKIKAACAVAAKELATSEGDDRSAKRAKGSIQEKLRWAIEVVILTPEQRQTLPQRGSRKKRSEPAPAPTETPAPSK